MAGIEDLIRFADTTIGWSDEGNTKRTPVHTWYNAKFGNPDPGKYAWDWCNGWVTYIAHQSGNAGPVCFNQGFAYTLAHAEAFRVRGQWHAGTSGIKRGDVIFFDWDGQDKISAIDHVGIVTGVRPDGLVETIEANTEDAVRRRVRKVFEIAGYGRPKYSTTTPPPPPPEGPPTVPGTYTPPPFPTGLRPGSSNPSARPLQKALKDAGYMSTTIPYADNYGPNTEAAVDRFYNANPSLTSPGSWDPIIGPKGWAELHREAYGGGKPPAQAPTPAPPVVKPVLGEPPHDYRRVTHGGRTVNVRTDIMLKAARGLMNASTPFSLTQGSYNRGVSASAGTHDGGGVVDINTNGMNVNAALLALRRAGFAAWYRTSAEGFSPHIHACAIGDREMAPGARSQVVAYFNGRNGLANGRADTAPASVGRPYPAWAAKYR